MAAAACGHGHGWARIARHRPAQNPSEASPGSCPAPPPGPERRPARPRPDGGGWSPAAPPLTSCLRRWPTGKGKRGHYARRKCGGNSGKMAAPEGARGGFTLPALKMAAALKGPAPGGRTAPSSGPTPSRGLGTKARGLGERWRGPGRCQRGPAGHRQSSRSNPGPTVLPEGAWHGRRTPGTQLFSAGLGPSIAPWAHGGLGRGGFPLDLCF